MSLVSGVTIVIIVAIVIFLIGYAVIWYVKTQKALLRLKKQIEEAELDIDDALVKRCASLTKMLETTKKYAKLETEAISIHNQKEFSIDDKQDFACKLDNIALELKQVIEKHPNIKADALFACLQNAIIDTGEHLHMAKCLYNSNVEIYNSKLISFPSNIVAYNKKLLKKKPFNIENNG